MTTFDEILPKLREIFQAYRQRLDRVGPLLVNRDLYGRVRLIIDESKETDARVKPVLESLARHIAGELAPHAYPAEQMVLFEPDIGRLLERETTFPLAEYAGVYVVDRLATEGDWAAITPPTDGVPRIVFFSIKGGVGRSTAMAVVAWALAQEGRRVMAIDLDLESPGLSAGLLPTDRRPAYGITDWLVEDLVDHGGTVFEDLVAASELSRDGEILVVPAYGARPGEYVAKLGRVWMPKTNPEGSHEGWFRRLNRLLCDLEKRWSPDVVLLDSRAGIDEIASACITGLGVSLVLLFAIDSDQTWSAYRMLFQYWRKMEVVGAIRERLQLVGAMAPETGLVEYLQGLRERAWGLFSEELYDEVSAGELPREDVWSFDEAEEPAPHHPWVVRWHRGFATLANLHTEPMKRNEITGVFGGLIDNLTPFLAGAEGTR